MCVGVLKYFHSYLGSDNFGRFKILNFSIFFFFFFGGGGGSEKLIFFGGMKILWISFGVITKTKNMNPQKWSRPTYI